MTCRKLTSLVKPAILVFCAVAFSLSASRATTANSRINAPAKTATIEHNANAVKRTLLRIISRKAKTNPKFAKSLSAACSCAMAPNAAVGFGECINSCLADAGVSWVTLATCGAICSSGNLVGCAICAGVQEWVVLACAQYCAWRRVFNNTEARQLRPSKTRDLYQANSLSKRAAASS
jgi:hypothetical protein